MASEIPVTDVHGKAADETNSASDTESVHGRLCLYCKDKPLEYETEGCRHAGACKKCAMKTGMEGNAKSVANSFPAGAVFELGCV
eukprot:CAMPEP_0172715220 /NCGR_PEP_ID=MMETSP1074-20121228/67422_1 /TAXON_ID=2916 /ORGANISM="Ceratium fusus, Strain PA161109" /LENGTH=84 /DNA_ID=CAMNT_0013539781 /DNA_START=28 /DNA_END=280 /DNA_ORIENTATION=+